MTDSATPVAPDLTPIEAIMTTRRSVDSPTNR